MTPCFNDLKRFCLVLRAIASGENGRPLAGFEAQKRAQAVLTECGYAWPGQVSTNGGEEDQPASAVLFQFSDGDPNNAEIKPNRRSSPQARAANRSS